MECPQLKALLDQARDNVLPSELRPVIEAHLEECHVCRAEMNRFIKIDQILQRTVYSDPAADNYLNFICHVANRKLRWGKFQPQTAPQEQKFDTRRLLILLLKVTLGFIIAAALGASLAMILGRLGYIGRPQPGPVAADSLIRSRTIRTDSSAAPSRPDTSAGQVSDSAGLLQPDSFSPESVSHLLNQAEPQATDPPVADSTRLMVLEAEASALRDALGRSPRDRSLIDRSIEKSRQIVDERQRLGLSVRVKDYYNLGYAYYQNKQYPQTVLVTTDGLQKVRIGPTEYLHYLKAMSHYQLGMRILQPLPADTSPNAEARAAGAVLRANLDAEGRRRGMVELRRAIDEFGYLLNKPELQPIAKNWILKCNDLTAKADAEP
jgi:hypothetical protein